MLSVPSLRPLTLLLPFPPTPSARSSPRQPPLRRCPPPFCPPEEEEEEASASAWSAPAAAPESDPEAVPPPPPLALPDEDRAGKASPRPAAVDLGVVTVSGEAETPVTSKETDEATEALLLGLELSVAAPPPPPPASPPPAPAPPAPATAADPSRSPPDLANSARMPLLRRRGVPPSAAVSVSRADVAARDAAAARAAAISDADPPTVSMLPPLHGGLRLPERGGLSARVGVATAEAEAVGGGGGGGDGGALNGTIAWM